ncbi:MAG TPA: thiamine pyrophosphate-dependent enzyme [Thermoanaerobaculia bacterium]|nr:thiamine pyrophosphate-dependent enzyme [Thermoanaerobaculia bacterium]
MTTLDRRSGTSLADRFAAFVAERFPFALEGARESAEEVAAEGPAEPAGSEAAIEALRAPLRAALERRFAPGRDRRSAGELPETTPGVAAGERLARAAEELIEACDGFFRREAITASLTRDEKRELLRGMLLTRATDNRLKAFFTGGEVRYRGRAFQGKGFRSLGQEAIYGAPLRLRRGERWRGADGSWQGDVVAPLIRDLGAALAMHPAPESVRTVLNAQMAKAGPPMGGKDLHFGDLSRGVLPAAAPLSISSLNVAGLALAFALGAARRPASEGGPPVAVSFIGEGGTSLGEWHEAVNLAAVRRLPAIFCVEDNGTALSTPVREQSAARVFADKAAGYGIPGITLDGTDPEAIAAAFAWAAERARSGLGPALIELVCLRMCGHAHHDDMLYLGRDPQPSWEYPQLREGAYADPGAYGYWATRDPIPAYAERLEEQGILAAGELDRWKAEAEELVEREARSVIEAPWPEPAAAGEGVYTTGPAAVHREPLADRRPIRLLAPPELPPVDPGLPFERDGRTFLEAVMLGVGDALRADERVFVFGEDVGGDYGNAFLLLRPLLAEHGGRILNSPLSEGAVLGACVGAALGGLRPIGEMQFNDFVATGFNQLVNNAAKIRYRWGASVPMVVRMPWGGLRKAGPYHSQNTEPWFYRTPGLKIVVPSTPEDARALLAAAVADPDPVLYYEHIALYRDPRIRQRLPDEPPAPLQLGRAALRRAGSDLAIVSYGAYVHVARRVAERLAADGVEAAVLDLRSLVPLDRDALLAVARHCGKVLVAHEDTRTGSIGESVAAILQEEAFEYLDAPVRVVGALDTPVPYSPPLEEAFLPGEERVERAARLLAAY